jgi:hypothetical protein
MARKVDKLKQIEEKIKRLKELKRKIQKQLKKEEKLAEVYAKEFVYRYGEMHSSNKPSAETWKALIRELSEVLCGRAKDKLRCLKRKAEIVLAHREDTLGGRIAGEILRRLEEES